MKEIDINPDLEKPLPLHLFASFFRLGITAFGGPAMIPYVRRLAVEKKKWIDPEDFKMGIALCQTIPGATVMQMAAYIGLKVGGIRDAAVCYAGFILPAFFLMLGLSRLYALTRTLPAVVSVFSGLQAVTVAVVAYAAFSFGKTSLKNMKNAFIALTAAVLFGFMANPVLIILLASLLGMLLMDGQPVQNRMPADPIRPATRVFLMLLAITAAGYAALFGYRKDFFQLAAIMSKIDLIAFGGGFASVPLMFHEIVENRGWLDGPTFLNGIVLGQFTPGPIVITATFVGYLLHGFAGACIATAGVFLPSFLILVGIAPWFDRLRAQPWFMRAISGIICSFAGLLFSVTLRLGWNVPRDWKHGALAVAAFTALYLKLDILWVVLAGTAMSLILF